jgi:hypothetical protein
MSVGEGCPRSLLGRCVPIAIFSRQCAPGKHLTHSGATVSSIHRRLAFSGLTERWFGLRDDQWEQIKHLLPEREGSVGATAADNRLFVGAVLYHYTPRVSGR